MAYAMTNDSESTHSIGKANHTAFEWIRSCVIVCVMAHRDVRSVVRANTMITQVKMIRAKISESLGVLFRSIGY